MVKPSEGVVRSAARRPGRLSQAGVPTSVVVALAALPVVRGSVEAAGGVAAVVGRPRRGRAGVHRRGGTERDPAAVYAASGLIHAVLLGRAPARVRILGTEPGRLRDAVGPRRRGGRRPRYDDLGLHMPPTSAAAIALERLGFVTEEDTPPHELVVVQTLGLDARSPWATLDFDILVRALRTGPVRLPSVHTFDHDEVAVPPQIIPLRGCRIGPELSMPEARTFGTALVLDDDSQAGDTRFCSYRVRWRADPRATRRVTYSVSRPVEEILVQADFAGGLSPVGTTRFVSFAEDGDERDRVPMNASHRVQATAHGFGPGVIGLAWDWE
ncbi:hypothetical protein [Brachybacterium huguangmaarense]